MFRQFVLVKLDLKQICHIPKLVLSCLVDVSHKIRWYSAYKEPTSMVQVPRLVGWRGLQMHDNMV